MAPVASAGVSTCTPLLRLGFQARIILTDKCADLVGHRQQLRPLLLVQRHREAPEPVNGNSTLLAHLEADRASALVFQPFVFRFEPFELGFQILIRHLDPRSAKRPQREAASRLYRSLGLQTGFGVWSLEFGTWELGVSN